MRAEELVKSVPAILISTIVLSVALGERIGYLCGAILGFAGAAFYVVIKHVVLKIPYKGDGEDGDERDKK
jgi:nitrate/nitrite transporter NarK